MPELAMMLVTDLAVLDHSDGTILLVANALRDPDGGDNDAAYDDAVARLDAMTAELAKPAEPSVVSVTTVDAPAYTRRTGAEEFMRTPSSRPRRRSAPARRSRSCCRSGSRWTADADALDVYRVLRAANPSPYMYLLRFPGRETPFEVVGSSPEALVKVTGDRALLHPIAGTKPRGATPEEDARLAAELLADPKERAEHVMLVDLGRNDLGRVCTPDSVEVLDFFAVERYSHVMHLVSTVVGEVAADRTAYDVLAACFPAGTLSGAPKVARDGDHRGARTLPAQPVRRRGRLPRRPRRPRHGHRDPHGRDQGRTGVRPGRRRHRRRLGPGGRGARVSSQGRSRARCGGFSRDLALRTVTGARRELLLVVVLTVIGAAVVLFATGEPWAHAVVREPPLPQQAVDLPGRSVAPLVAALGLVGFAAVVALLATRGVARLVIGILIAVVGAVIVGSTASISVTDVRTGSALRDRASAAALHDAQVSVRLESWRHVAAGGGLALAAAGLVAAARGRSWAAMGRRFDAPIGAPTAEPAAPMPSPPATPIDDGALWDQLEHGEDPTA